MKEVYNPEVNDAVRATKKYDHRKEAWEPEHISKYTTLADHEPVLIESTPDALDRLGLKEAREMMDRAHNDMILKKYNLAIEKELPGYLPGDRPDPLNTSPFDVMAKDDTPPRPTADRIQLAIDAKPYTDPEYRETAKQFLAEVLPEAEAENARLLMEITRAREELAKVTEKYKKKLKEAKEAYNDFNKDMGKEWRKFETANSGIRTRENHVVTSEKCTPIFMIEPAAGSPQIEGLRGIKKVIEQYEARKEWEQNPEYMKELARFNARESDHIKSETQGMNGGFLASLFGRK